MGAVNGEEQSQWDTQSLNAQQEKIFVSVRLRPLNEKETARNDVSDWECINNTTIIFKNSLPERSMFPTAYTFDRVFGCDSSTEKVYEEGAKEVALSAVSGINSSIFAYGQTSSGKTYTMSGITEYAVADIYNYIEKHKDREFVMKFSAMEIYNEAVRDLLSADSTPLRLLDDPERGTVVEKLTEETLTEWSHLQELLSICDAQRQIGETSLNETSSRSHQILRLTIESSAREFLCADNSSTLSAIVNFVDLAGSERASQTLSAGARLKEGCHINRSLLTLGTVIRKLSKGKHGHVPYRDSKLTRILQTSLGGNARTAIICTMSPARSHVEQSRNTLLFASCAKEVSTNAQVNVLMSDKALVKHLQRELARLENELQSAGSTLNIIPNSAALLREKELQIEKMNKEIKELIQQRDLAESRVNDLLLSVGGDQADSDPSLDSQLQNARMHEYSASGTSAVTDPQYPDVVTRTINTEQHPDGGDGLNYDELYLQIPDNSEDHFLCDGTSSQLSISTPKFAGPDPCKGWEEIVQINRGDSEDMCKEVRCIEIEESSRNRNIDSDAFSRDPEEKERKISLAEAGGDDDISSTFNGDMELSALKQKVQRMQRTIDRLVGTYPVEPSPFSLEGDVSNSKSLKRSKSWNSSQSPLWFEKVEQDENTSVTGVEKDFPGKPEDFHLKLSYSNYGALTGNLSRKSSQTSLSSASIDEKALNRRTQSLDITGDYNVVAECSSIMDEKARNVKTTPQENITGDHNVVAAVDGVAKLNSEKKFDDDLGAPQSNSWPLEFERLQRQIIELWDACNVPLMHRTYFFLLFKGDSSDSVYLEVELRRLSYLKDTLSNGSKHVTGQTLTLASSLKDLNREREMLSKQVYKKYLEQEREGLYKKWNIGLNTKQRRLQLAHCIWTDTKDMEHIKESAAVVAKLVGFIEPAQTPKEMFGLSLLPQLTTRRSFNWKHSMSSLN